MKMANKNYEEINRNLITQHACTSLLRCLKVYLLTLKPRMSLLEYDIIVPRVTDSSKMGAKEDYISELILKHYKIKDQDYKINKSHKTVLGKETNPIMTKSFNRDLIQEGGIADNKQNTNYMLRQTAKEEYRKHQMLNSMFDHSLASSPEDEEDEAVEKKLQEFVIHPLVYPTLESLTQDINFKTFQEFEAGMIK